jgi:protein-disulfide isomerase
MRIDSNTVSNVTTTAACLVIVVLGGLQIAERLTRTTQKPPNPITDVAPVDVPIANARLQGNSGAGAAIVEFSDFQCPFCGKYARETFEEVKREFVTSGRIKYAFVHFPLPNHQYAKGAAAAAECANAQGRFWPMHDRLFAKQDLLEPANLIGLAREAGLDLAPFQVCLDGSPQQFVETDIALGRRVGVQSTPTFLLGTVNADGSVHVTKKILGAQPPEVFRRALQVLTGG